MRKNFKAGALTAPLPAVLVTVGDMENANIITIGWTGILSTIPPRTYISVRPRRYSYGILKEKMEFVINLPRSSQAWEVDYAGIYTGAKSDKFKECGFTKTVSAEVSAPTIAECPISLECRVTEIIPMGTHDVFIADIVSVSCDESVLDGDGKICFDKADLLAYAHGEYFAIGDKVGAFGFSTRTKKGRSFVASGKKPKGACRDKIEAAERQKTKRDGRTGQNPRVINKPENKNSSEKRSRAENAKGLTKGEEKTASPRENGHVPFYLGINKKSKRRGR